MHVRLNNANSYVLESDKLSTYSAKTQSNYRLEYSNLRDKYYIKSQ